METNSSTPESPRSLDGLLIALQAAQRDNDRRANDALLGELLWIFLSKKHVYVQLAEKMGCRSPVHAAEDAMQRFLLTLSHKAGMFDPSKGSADVWLHTIMKNKLRDQREKQASTADRENGIFDENMPDPSPGPERIAEGKDTLRAMYEYVRGLPPGAIRDDVMLWLFADLTPSRIAERTGEIPNTIVQRIKRMKKELRERFEDPDFLLEMPASQERETMSESSPHEQSERSRERIEITPEQSAAMATMTTEEIRAYLDEPEMSKATASRLRNGQTYYHRAYHEREMAPDLEKARRYRNEILAATERGVRNALQTLLTKHGAPDPDALFRPLDARDIHDRVHRIVTERFGELAGAPEMDSERWRNQVAYHRAIREFQRHHAEARRLRE